MTLKKLLEDIEADQTGIARNRAIRRFLTDNGFTNSLPRSMLNYLEGLSLGDNLMRALRNYTTPAAANPPQLVGYKSVNSSVLPTGGTVNVSLTDLTGGSDSAPSEGDLIIYAYATSDIASRAPTKPSGYINVQNLRVYANGSSADSNLSVACKFAGAAETSITLGARADTNNGGACIITVWRNVHNVVVMDSSPQYKAATAAVTGTPYNINTHTDNAIGIVIMAGATVATPVAYTDPGDLDLLYTTKTDTNTRSVTMAVGAKSLSAGNWQPSGMSGPTADGAGSWTSLTLSLRSADDTSYINDVALFGSGENGWLYKTKSFQNMWQDTAGTIAASASTNPVARIDDLSGNGNHALQSTSSAQGTAYLSGSMRTLTGDYYDTGTRPAASGTLMVRCDNAVVNLAGSNYSPAANGRVGIYSDSVNRNVGYHGNYTTGSLTLNLTNKAGANQSTGTYSIAWNGTTVDGYIDGWQSKSVAQNGFANEDYNFYLGADNQGGTAANTGTFYHWASMFINRYLTEKEVCDIHNQWVYEGYNS